MAFNINIIQDFYKNMQMRFELKNEAASFALINVGMVQESQFYPSYVMSHWLL